MSMTTNEDKTMYQDTLQGRIKRAQEVVEQSLGDQHKTDGAGASIPATVSKTRQALQRAKAQGNLSGMSQGQIGDFLQSFAPQLQKVLPKHLTPERIIQMVASTVHRNPAIARCSIPSLLGAVMQASLLGFQPIDSLGYCYLVPYGKDVQFQIGYKGMIDLARRSGKIQSVYAEVVREGDEFDCQLGLERTLTHRPAFDSGKPVSHAYAVCHYSDGGYSFVVLSRADIERLRMRSPMQKAQPSGAWATDYEAMAKAKALKQLAKYMPLSVDEQATLQTDEHVLTLDHFAEGGVLKAEELEELDTLEADAEEIDPTTGEVKG